MRQEVEELIRLGPLPADDALDEETARRCTDAIDALPVELTAEEAHALIGILPPDDSTAFGLAWSVLHAIEASPSWPLWSSLDDRSWWVTLLRGRCSRAGRQPQPLVRGQEVIAHFQVLEVVRGHPTEGQPAADRNPRGTSPTYVCRAVPQPARLAAGEPGVGNQRQMTADCPSVHTELHTQ